MKINAPMYYLKIINAMDDIVKPKAERIVFGDAAQYQQLKELAIAYTAKENCLALVGYINSYLPEKAYFEGKELLVVVDERDNLTITVSKTAGYKLWHTLPFHIICKMQLNAKILELSHISKCHTIDRVR